MRALLPAIFGMPVAAHRPAAPAHRPARAGLARRPAPAEPQQQPLRRAQPQIPGAEPGLGADRRSRAAHPGAAAAMPARLSNALPSPGLRHDPGILRASPRAATRHSHQLHEPGRYKPATTQGLNPPCPAGAKPLLSRADLLPDCYPKRYPSTPKHTEKYSNHSHDLCGAMGIRTPDLLHAMKATPSPPPAQTRRDQPKQRRGATPSDSEQRPPTLICYPNRYPGHAR